MSKEAMKLALEALEAADWYINQLEITLYSADDAGTHEDRLKVQQAITVMRLEIDALNMASKPALAEQPYPENFIDALKYDAAKRDFWEGYVPEPVKPEVCCGEYATCLRACTPRGKWLANEALDRMAENARELGLDYEPAQYSDIVSDGGMDPRNKFDQPVQPRAWFTIDELNAWADKKLKENPQWAEQPAQQEPVAWMCHPFGDEEVEYGPHQQCENCIPLYTSPPAQRTWVGLTDEERKLVRNSVGYNQFVTAGEYAEHVQKATEFKLRSKNEDRN